MANIKLMLPKIYHFQHELQQYSSLYVSR